jgi:hypothetical protein
MKIDLDDEEWECIMTSMRHSSASPGFNPKYNPMPWTTKFHATLKKLEAAFKTEKDLTK